MKDNAQRLLDDLSHAIGSADRLATEIETLALGTQGSPVEHRLQHLYQLQMDIRASLALIERLNNVNMILDEIRGGEKS